MKVSECRGKVMEKEGRKWRGDGRVQNGPISADSLPSFLIDTCIE